MTRARNHTDDVEWSAEDATRTEHDFLCRVVEAAIKAGATTINIPDTVGYATPEEYPRLYPHAARARAERGQGGLLDPLPQRSRPGRRQFAGRRRGGARQIECTINGLGERAGNAALEEVVMAIKTRGDILPYYTNIDATHADAGLQAGVGGVRLPGAVQQGDRRQERLRARSGIHQDGILKNAQTYEIMTPESSA